MKVRIGDYVKFETRQGNLYHGRVCDKLIFPGDYTVYFVKSFPFKLYYGSTRHTFIVSEDWVVRVYRNRYKKSKKENKNG